MKEPAPAVPQGIGVYDRPASSPISPVMIVGGLVAVGSAIAALIHFL
jgi:hypothetical protein